MKTLTLLLFFVPIAMLVTAQEQSSLPKISEQLVNYYAARPIEKVYVMTDKVRYKPGETIWFSAAVTESANAQSPAESKELFVKLYDKKGTSVVTEVFKLAGGFTPGDLQLPDDIAADDYYLVAYTSQQMLNDDFSVCRLVVDPLYQNQLIAQTTAKDSISTAGSKNELQVVLRKISGEVVKNTSFKYQILNGADVIEKDKFKTDAAGKAVIPFSIPAKTNGEPFTCVLTDTHESWHHEVFLPTNLDPLVLKFYPEGGHLIGGIPCKVGFTAFNKWGMPVDVEGTITDEKGNQVAVVKTISRGIGLFSFAQEGNQKYKLKITAKTGKDQVFDLPKPETDGLAFSVAKSDREFISANLAFADKKQHDISLTVTHGTGLFWAADMSIDGTGRIKIPADNLPGGLNLISVFSKNGDLLAERIVFQDLTNDLKIDINPEKNSLQEKQGMKVNVSLNDRNGTPVSGILMISVADKTTKTPEKPSLQECLLLGSELENPYTLISDVLPDKLSNSGMMDIFLIANKLKNFDWNAIKAYRSGSSDAASRTVPISGIVTDKNGDAVYKAKVSLVNNKSMQIFTTTTNEGGRFSFQNLNATNLDDFTAKATDPNGKKELTVQYDKNFDARMKNFISNYALRYSLSHRDEVIAPEYFANNENHFQKVPKPVRTNTTADFQKKLLSSSTNLMDVIKTMKPYKLVNNQIVFIGSENSFYFQSGALLVLDGQQLGTDISSISSISPLEIDHINISTNPMDIQRYTGLNNVGIIEIFMKGSKSSLHQAPEKVQPKSNYDGIYRLASEFSTKKSGVKEGSQTTLEWIPSVTTDQNGKYEFNLAAGKIISSFEIEVQAMTHDGKMGSAKIVFPVTK